MTRETWAQSLRVAEAWFKRSFKATRLTKSGSLLSSHPMMTMDNMPHAGASQVHPHVHMIASETLIEGAIVDRGIHQTTAANRKHTRCPPEQCIVD